MQPAGPFMRSGKDRNAFFFADLLEDERFVEMTRLDCCIRLTM